MNLERFVISTVICFAMGLSTVQADDRHHPGQGEAGGQAAPAPVTGMGMMDMGRMQEHMQDMQQTMDRIHKTDDPGEHMRLMQEHMQQMHEMMGDMRGMMGSGMMMQGGARGKGDAGPMVDMPMEDRQQMMERRMDMMQGMMEQMMAHMMAQQDLGEKGDKGKRGMTIKER